MRLVIALGSLLIVVLLGGCSSEAKEEKPQASTVPQFSVPKALPNTAGKANVDKAPAKKVGFQ